MRRRFRDVRGSVSVEFAAVLPLVAVSLLLVAQIGLLVSEQLVVQHAAREGAREAAVWNDDGRAGNLDPARTTITISPEQRDVGTPVRVEVRYTPVQMPVVGRFMPASTTLHAAVEMRTERAPPDAAP
jgi:Flp pilus assembly protein TadG